MNITQQELSSMPKTKLSDGLKEGGILNKNTLHDCWIYFWLKYNYCNNFLLVEYGWKNLIAEKCLTLISTFANPQMSRLELNLQAKERRVFIKCVYEYSNNLSYLRIIDCCLHYPNMCIWTWWTNLFHCLQISVTDTLFLWTESIKIQIAYTFFTDQTSSMDRKKAFLEILEENRIWI